MPYRLLNQLALRAAGNADLLVDQGADIGGHTYVELHRWLRAAPDMRFDKWSYRMSGSCGRRGNWQRCDGVDPLVAGRPRAGSGGGSFAAGGHASSTFLVRVR